MSIRNTSINDYYTNYIFNFNNNSIALKSINDFAVNEIKQQKHYTDSLKKAGKKNITSNNIKDILAAESFLSGVGEDVHFYTPPSELSFEQVNEDDLVMLYELNENAFTIKNIKIGNSYVSQPIEIKEIPLAKNCKLQVDVENLNLGILKQILNKINTLNYHTKKEVYGYDIYTQKIHILTIAYSEQGKALKLYYK